MTFEQPACQKCKSPLISRLFCFSCNELQPFESEIDLFEVNEAFASVPLAWLKATQVDPEKLNVFGGAIALGHPLGSSGTKLATTLIHALKTKNAKLGLQTMCEGGGMANVTIFENC